MESKLYHIEINVKNLTESSKFYKKLFNFLNWKKITEEDNYIGYTNNEASIFLVQTNEKYIKNKFHRKNTGLNHIAFRVKSKKDVDNFYEFLKKNNINVLYNGPKEYPEYCEGYYAIYFEDPDRIKLEVVYIP